MSVKAKADAIDKFVRTLRSAGLYDDIQAACVMAGWTNLAGALYPFKGSAPTNNGFLAADLDAGIGLKGDGATKYLDSNRANNADPQNDKHISVYLTGSLGTGTFPIGDSTLPGRSDIFFGNPDTIVRINGGSGQVVRPNPTSGLVGGSRNYADSFNAIISGTVVSQAGASSAPSGNNIAVFARNNGGIFDSRTASRLAWYSIGSSTDLAALDSAVSTLMADLRAIDEDGFEPESVNYIRAVEAADGSFLETGVKKAINRFIVGCKKDGIWDALKASCILCGARTIAGALVPLAGTAPTAYNFTSANYNRETGLVGVPASNTYIDTNRNNNADPQNDQHLAMYVSQAATNSTYSFGTGLADAGTSSLTLLSSAYVYARSRSSSDDGGISAFTTGLCGVSRSESAQFKSFARGLTKTTVVASQTPLSGAIQVFKASGASTSTNARIAFYSIGSAIPDLSLLDARVSTLVSQIAAAIP